MGGKRCRFEIGACVVLLSGSFEVPAADSVFDHELPKGPSITVTAGESSDARSQRTVVVGECHKRLYSVTVSGLGEGKGYLSLEVNHRAVRKYSDEPFVRDVLREKQIIRLYLRCGPSNRDYLQVRAFGIAFENPEQPQYFEMSFGLSDSGKWAYLSGIVPVSYEIWLRDVGVTLQR
jgi:hypothetical protein